MSTTTCYHCDGLGTVPDGLDQFGDARDCRCSHCGGTGQEPEGNDPEDRPRPDSEACVNCYYRATCKAHNDRGLDWCPGWRTA